MANNSIIPQSNIDKEISDLLDQWLAAERAGVAFPVPFDSAWPMAGYGRKSTAKRDGLKGLKNKEHFCTDKCKNGRAGRSSELIMLSLDGFKHLCLMADTPEGEAIRQYYIESEKLWQTVKQVDPVFAQEVEILKLRKEVLQLEDKTLSLRHYIVTALPKAVGDRILGVTEIETVKVKEVVVNERGQILGHVPGESYNKKELCERYGILTKTGKPDYKQINAYLDGLKLPGDAWEDRQVVSHNPQLKAEFLPALDKLLGKVDRQQWIGE